jgi:hypothetical protein
MADDENGELDVTTEGSGNSEESIEPSVKTRSGRESKKPRYLTENYI